MGKQAEGFTLIEVMLALTLMSIMLVLLFSAMRISAQSWDKGESKIAQVNEAAVVYNFFQRHLASAKPLWDDDKGVKQVFGFQPAAPARTFSFQGSTDSVRFVSAFPASALRSGLQLFTVELIRNQDGSNAVKVLMEPFFLQADGEDWDTEEEILLDDVDRFELAYFGSDDNSQEGYWQDTWQERKALPSLVKISIARTDEAFWPDMIVAVKTAEAVLDQQAGSGSPFERERGVPIE